MSLFTSIFRKTASTSQSKNIASARNTQRAQRSSMRVQISLMDRVGRMEVSE